MPSLRENRHIVVAALGITQILGWGCSFYFPAVLAMPVVRETGWPFEAVIGGVSAGLLMAGLVSPLVGRLIAEHGGRPVLAASSPMFAAGLVMLALSPSLAIYYAGWIVIGAAIGAGLYDAVFAALGRAYGEQARNPIATITLFGGFASTVCWPLSAWLEQRYGWRATCLVYAALHLGVCLPLQFMLPSGNAGGPQAVADPVAAPVDVSPAIEQPMRVFVLLGAIMTVVTSTGMIFLAHLVALLAARGVDATQAIALGTLFGPAQVGARVVERMFGARYHPLWTLQVAVFLMAVSFVLLAVGFALLALVIVLFGAGFGISWIARGTVPLALFGAQRYPRVIGRLAMPSLIGQALAPTLGAVIITHWGGEATLSVLAAAAVLNFAAVALLWRWRAQAAAR